jgi:hypothetical protein
MEYWSTGVLEYWSTGVLEYWSTAPIGNCTPRPRGWECFQGNLGVLPHPGLKPFLIRSPRALAIGIIDAANELDWNKSILPGTTNPTDLSSEGNAPTFRCFSILAPGVGP